MLIGHKPLVGQATPHLSIFQQLAELANGGPVKPLLRDYEVEVLFAERDEAQASVFSYRLDRHAPVRSAL